MILSLTLSPLKLACEKYKVTYKDGLYCLSKKHIFDLKQKAKLYPEHVLKLSNYALMETEMMKETMLLRHKVEILETENNKKIIKVAAVSGGTGLLLGFVLSILRR
jgi:hypothetical protein